MTAAGAAALDRRSPARRAALVLWLPVLAPLLLGMLRHSEHALHWYLLSGGLVPGLAVSVWLRLDEAWFFVVAGVVTLALFALVRWSLARLSRGWAIALQVAVVALVGLEAVAYARMLCW